MSQWLDELSAIANDDTDDLVLLRAESRAILFTALAMLPDTTAGWLNPENPLDEVTDQDLTDLNFMKDGAISDIIRKAQATMYIVGEIREIAHTTVPPLWLACHGQSLLRASYPDLFNAIGILFGSVDSTHFTLPDFRDRFAIGANPIAANGGIARTGGAATVTLDITQMPAHTHTERVQPNTGASTNRIQAQTASGAVQDSALTTGSTGGGLSHENMPPFLGVEKIIYAGA